jgi:hypothetical protein
LRISSNLPRRALATVLAACAHLVVLLLLGWKVPRIAVQAQARDEAPTIELFLVRPEPPPRKLPPTQSPKPAPPAAPTSAAPRIVNIPTPEAPLVSAPKPVPPVADADAEGDRVRNALRGLLGCTSATARLTEEEQRACHQRLAEAKPAPVGPLYTAKEAEAFDNPKYKDSIFVRKPHNECLPHIGSLPPAGGTPAPVSGAKSTGFGIACAWSFW